MDEQSKKQAVDALLALPMIARIATAEPGSLQPHVVPVWFGWDGVSIWISSFESTRKVREIRRNARVSIVVDRASADGLTNDAVIMEGTAELVTEPRSLVEEKSAWVYERYLGPEGVQAPDPQSWIRDPQNLMIRLTPEKVYAWFTPAPTGE